MGNCTHLPVSAPNDEIMPMTQTISAPSSSGIESKSRAAREHLDAHVREMIQWHFSPDTGCPFWLDVAKQRNWDPRKTVHSYADLSQFGHFEDDWLRGGPVRRLSLIHISEPTRLLSISYAVFCLKKK